MTKERFFELRLSEEELEELKSLTSDEFDTLEKARYDAFNLIKKYLHECEGVNADGITRCFANFEFGVYQNGESYPREEHFTTVPVGFTYGDDTFSMAFDFTEDDISLRDIVNAMKTYEDAVEEYIIKINKLSSFAGDEDMQSLIEENVKTLQVPYVFITLMPAEEDGMVQLFLPEGIDVNMQGWFLSSRNNELNSFAHVLTMTYKYTDIALDENTGFSISKLIEREEEDDDDDDMTIKRHEEENGFSKALMEATLDDGIYNTDMMSGSYDNNSNNSGVRLRK